MNSKKRAGSGIASQILLWGGMLLLLVGSLLLYPYVNSRLAAPIPSPFPSPSVLAPEPTDISFLLTDTSTPMPTRAHTPTPSPTPTPIPASPSRIVISSIGIDAPVVPVSWRTAEVEGQTQATWEVPDAYAAGWHETSASLGAHGNTVLNGHNTTNGEIFRNLYTLKAGEVITVYSDHIPYTYIVTETLILPEAGQPLDVRLKNASYILPTEDERLTIVTCHPYGSLRYRLIVIARPQ